MKLLKEKNEKGEPGTYRKTIQLQKKVRLERYLVKTVIRMLILFYEMSIAFHDLDWKTWQA